MQIIPLVRSKYVYAFSSVLDSLGVSSTPLLKRAGLTNRVFEDPETVIPAHQAWRFIGSAAEAEGIHDFGLVAGDIAIQDYGAFSKRLLRATNLYRALKIFCELALHEYSRADFYVSQSEHATWFCRGPIDGTEVEKKHVELLVLTMMISTVRMAAGPDWYPSEVYVQTKDSHGVECHSLFAQSTVRFGNRITALEISRDLLGMDLKSVEVSSTNHSYDRLEHDFPVAIRQIVDEMIQYGKPKIANVSESLGTSARTLQRRLAEIDSSFSQVVEESRIRLANKMVTETDDTLGEIAHNLGYSDQAHFTRAFKRWNGVTPGALRIVNSRG